MVTVTVAVCPGLTCSSTFWLGTVKVCGCVPVFWRVTVTLVTPEGTRTKVGLNAKSVRAVDIPLAGELHRRLGGLRGRAGEGARPERDDGHENGGGERYASGQLGHRCLLVERPGCGSPNVTDRN